MAVTPDTGKGIAVIALLLSVAVTGKGIARQREREARTADVDLDGFKAIDDTHGHDTGDRVLVAAMCALERAHHEQRDHAWSGTSPRRGSTTTTRELPG